MDRGMTADYVPDYEYGSHSHGPSTMALAKYRSEVKVLTVN